MDGPRRPRPHRLTRNHGRSSPGNGWSLYAFAAAGCGTTTCQPRRVISNLGADMYDPLSAPAIVGSVAYVATCDRGLVALKP